MKRETRINCDQRDERYGRIAVRWVERNREPVRGSRRVLENKKRDVEREKTKLISARLLFSLFSFSPLFRDSLV